MTFEEQIGHHLMIGVPGSKLTPAIIKQFQKTHAAGLIVFRPNFKSASAFKKFLTGLEKALGRKLLIAVDHEGGRVIHLAEGITVFPDNWTLGNTGDVSYAAKQGKIEAKELRRLGIDLNLAPTLDVLTEQFSPNIGIRSYGKKTNRVAKLGAARIWAMQKSGISACAKHFPGLGAATLDPHLDLPVLAMTWKELKNIHLKPFLQAMKAGVDCIMSSHVVYPNLEVCHSEAQPKNLKTDPSLPLRMTDRECPVTFSRKIIRGFLREELGFRGVILSDDLEMGALRGLCSAGESAVRAVEAGHDMVLFCHDLLAQEEAYEALLEAYQNGRLKPENLFQTSGRVETLIAKRSKRFEGGLPRAEKEGEKLASKVAEQGVLFSPAAALRAKRSNLQTQIASDKKRPRNDEPWKVFFPDFSGLAKKFYIEKEMLRPKNWLRNFFMKQGINASVKTVCLDPRKKETENVLKHIRQGHSIFFCYDAHLFAGARKILMAAAAQKKNAAVLLRDPYDAVYIKGKIPFVTAYGFRKVQIEAAVRKLCKQFKAGQ